MTLKAWTLPLSNRTKEASVVGGESYFTELPVQLPLTNVSCKKMLLFLLYFDLKV